MLAHIERPVSTTKLPAVGLCAVALPSGGPSIRVLQMPDVNGYLVAYDRGTWTDDQIQNLMWDYLGDYELVRPAAD